MTIKQRLLGILAFQIITFFAYGQSYSGDGYIINNANDTIFGQLEYATMGFGKKCTFIKHNASSIEFLSPEEIKQFFISPNMYFYSIENNGKKVFLKALSQGKINLYKSGYALYIFNSSAKLIQLKGGQEIFWKDGKRFSKSVNTYKVQIKRAVSDTAFYQRIDSLNFDKNSIVELINEINNHGSSKPVNEKKEKKRIYFDVEFGYVVNAFYLYHLPDYIFSNNYLEDPHLFNSLSFGLNMKRKIINNNAYLKLGINYKSTCKNTIDHFAELYSVDTEDGGVYMTQSIIGTETSLFSYKLASISIPISVNVELSSSKFRPYIEAGINNTYYVKKDITQIRTLSIEEEFVDENLYSKVETVQLQMPDYIFSANLGLGFRYLVSRNHSVSTGVKVDVFSVFKSGTDFGKLRSNTFYVAFNF